MGCPANEKMPQLVVENCSILHTYEGWGPCRNSAIFQSFGQASNIMVQALSEESRSNSIPALEKLSHSIEKRYPEGRLPTWLRVVMSVQHSTIL